MRCAELERGKLAFGAGDTLDEVFDEDGTEESSVTLRRRVRAERSASSKSDDGVRKMLSMCDCTSPCKSPSKFKSVEARVAAKMDASCVVEGAGEAGCDSNGGRDLGSGTESEVFLSSTDSCTTSLCNDVGSGEATSSSR